MSAGSLTACLHSVLGETEKAHVAVHQSVRQVELMHYLKSLSLTLCLSPPIHSKSQKAKGHWHNGDKEVLHPPAHTNDPIKHTHKPVNTHTHTQLPMTYHRCPHTVHTFKATHTHTLVFCSQPSLNSFPCILQLACHSSPHRYQSLSLPDLIMAPLG